MPLKKNSKALVPKQTHLPAALAEYAEDGDAGFEEADSNAYTIPRIYLLQPLSPAVQKGDPTTYIEGAEPGMFLNTVTKELHSSFLMIPVLFRQTFVEWLPDRGGLVAEHQTVDPSWKRERGPYITPEGNEVNDTRNFYCMYKDGEAGKEVEPKPVLISLTSTQIRRASDLMTVMKNKRGRDANNRPFTMPMFSNMFEVTSDLNKNDNGIWHGWVFTDMKVLIPRDSEVFDTSKALRESVSSGRVKAEPIDVTEESRAATGGSM